MFHYILQYKKINMNKKIIENAATACNEVDKAISEKQWNRPCRFICPGRNALINILNQLIVEIKDVEPECFQRLMLEVQDIKNPRNDCLRLRKFGAVNAITSILKNKYIDAKEGKRKIFISHSHSDETIIKGFVKEILKGGCGFKDSDIFCTLDASTIRTGDDFREKIVENMRDCDFILLFISENYNQSEVCKNEMGAAWALENKRILPFTFPGITFEQMGFLNVVKQGASLTDENKLDELYQELCVFYELTPDWRSFNIAKRDFINIISKI